MPNVSGIFSYRAVGGKFADIGDIVQSHGMPFVLIEEILFGLLHFFIK